MKHVSIFIMALLLAFGMMSCFDGDYCPDPVWMEISERMPSCPGTPLLSGLEGFAVIAGLDSGGIPYAHLQTDYYTWQETPTMLGTASNHSPCITSDYNYSLRHYFGCSDSSNNDRLFVYKCLFYEFGWTNLGQPASPGPASHCAISANAYDYLHTGTSNDNIYAAYSEPTNNARLAVRFYTNGQWQDLGPQPVSAGPVSNISIVMSEGIVWVAYSDGLLNGSITVKKFQDNAWSTVGSAGFSPPGCNKIKLTVDKLKAPWIAFIDTTATNRPSLMTFSSNGWVYSGSKHIIDSEILDFDFITIHAYYVHPIIHSIVLLLKDTSVSVLHYQDSIWTEDPLFKEFDCSGSSRVLMSNLLWQKILLTQSPDGTLRFFCYNM